MKKKTLIINSKNPRSFPDNGKIPVKLLGSRRNCLALFLWVTCQFYWCCAVMMREQGPLCCGCPQRQYDGQQSAFCDSRKYPSKNVELILWGFRKRKRELEKWKPVHLHMRFSSSFDNRDPIIWRRRFIIGLVCSRVVGLGESTVQQNIHRSFLAHTHKYRRLKTVTNRVHIEKTRDSILH